MKTRILATVLILSCWFVLAPGLLRAEENQWYQGQQGQWQRQGNSWRWGSTHGDQWYQGQQGHWYREGNRWRWYPSHGDQWYQGRQGHWYREGNGWRWYGDDGDEYRRGSNGWQWSSHNYPDRRHDPDRD